MDIASAIKEVIVLGLEIERSIAKVRCNKETSARLSAEIAHDLSELESLLHGYSFRDGYELYAALDLVKREMKAVHESCAKLIPTTNKTKVLSATKAKFKAWRKRDDIETELVQLKIRVHSCLSKFTAYSTARIERTSHRVEHALIGHIVENRVQAQRIGGILETYLIGTQAGAQIVAQMAAIAYEDHAHQTLEYQYLHVLVTRLHDLIQYNASRHGYNSTVASHAAEFDVPPEEPDWYHSEPINPYLVEAQDAENAVFRILAMLKDHKDFGDQIPIQQSASALGDLACELACIYSLRGPANKLRSWAIKLYRALARSDISFLPFLALHLFNYNDLPSIQEAYTISSTIHSTVPQLHSPKMNLLIINQYVRNLMEHKQFEKALPEAQNAVDDCRSLWASSLGDIDSWSLQEDGQYETVFAICHAFSNLSICLTHSGQLDSSYMVARESREIFNQLPHAKFLVPVRDKSPDAREYRIAASRTTEAFVTLSLHLRKADRPEDAYNAVTASFGPAIGDRYRYGAESPSLRQSFLETLQIMHLMHDNHSLHYSQLEDLIHVLHAGQEPMASVCIEAISIYAQLCLECAANTVDDHIVGFERWDELFAAADSERWFISSHLPPDILHQLSAFPSQLSTFLSRNLDIIWDVIFHFADSSGSQPNLKAILLLIFTWDYGKNADVMVTKISSLPSFRQLPRVLQAMKDASIHLETSMVDRLLSTCTNILQRRIGLVISELDTFHGPFPYYSDIRSELSWMLHNYTFVLDVCGLHHEALEVADEMIHDDLIHGDLVLLDTRKLRIEILTRLNRVDEAVSVARDWVNGWKAHRHALYGYAQALDILSTTLALAGDKTGAAKVRTEADTAWSEHWDQIPFRVPPDVQPGTITEVVEEVITESVEGNTLEVPKSEITSSSVCSKPVDEDPQFNSTTKLDPVSSPSHIDDEVALAFKVTYKCINATLGWGAVYLVVLAILLAAYRM
ncbi:hypothetical protein C8J56DRAFT_928558 [Mycena floridula]|nr:hypothetical protein C8J56DRAFT_928558 [Mycena floridula]